MSFMGSFQLDISYASMIIPLDGTAGMEPAPSVLPPAMRTQLPVFVFHKMGEK